MTEALRQITDRVRAAAADGTPLALRGGGTKDFYGEPARGAPLDLRPLAGIVDYEPSELVVTVQAGTPLDELEAVLAERGQCLPFEPPHFGTGGARATVGGMVAAGLSGPSRARSGAVRDYVLGAHLLNGRAELLQFGGTVMKNVAGYDVSRLLAGSLGTLGVITQVSLKVLPVAPAEATLRFTCSQADALALLHGWGGQPLPLDASCWVQEDPADAASGTLYLRLRGAVAAVEAACARLGGTRVDAAPEDRARVAADWTACRDQRLPWFADRPAGRDLWRLSVPQTAPVLPLPADRFGAPLVEWHGGQRWVQAPAGDAAAAQALRQVAREVGGHATLFIAAGAGGTGAEARFDALSAPLEAIHRRLKTAFDPAGIFNPGRLVPGL
ncbi:glycolate oxidase subunit GlcE [uncultured Xylophilus sp.]|uniref:glycolate oxidase subunit GlcE n=1 Tax=uncultured Xylophilus sp. TaxID=296832 RepID=UPI0025E09139|nr:glycolate oxidase subunit GlcE [uncultured Xylophilus sp.]